MTAQCGQVLLESLERAVIPLGFRATVPVGIEAQIRARSGLALKRGLIVANGPGTIDPDYIGEWGVLVLNAPPLPIRILHGERIAQLVLARPEVLTLHPRRGGEVHQPHWGIWFNGQSLVGLAVDDTHSQWPGVQPVPHPKVHAQPLSSHPQKHRHRGSPSHPPIHDSYEG